MGDPIYPIARERDYPITQLPDYPIPRFIYIHPVRDSRNATVAVNSPTASISMNGILLAVCGKLLRAGVRRPVGVAWPAVATGVSATGVSR